MKIELHHIKVKDLYEGYKDSGELKGVVAYGGKLDVRPPFQRLFVYDDKKRNAVIETLVQGFPLNVMYWVDKGDGTYEILDGQQRTISICQYLNHDFSIMGQDGKPYYINNWTKDKQEEIMNYELLVYFCSGSDTEKLGWFKTINIAGAELSAQELRNAVYAGEWLTDAKRYFSHFGCAAIKVGDKYVKAEYKTQGYLEKALSWIAKAQGITIEEYMAKHQHDKEASELWQYYRKVIQWVEDTFIKYRAPMKGVAWDELYQKYGADGQHYDVNKLEEEISTLFTDVDVQKQSGIYEYVFDHQERYLNIRAFNKREKQTAFERQKGRCPICQMTFKIEEMEADHIVPWSKGGHTTPENCQCLCKDCNRKKGNS